MEKDGIDCEHILCSQRGSKACINCNRRVRLEKVKESKNERDTD